VALAQSGPMRKTNQRVGFDCLSVITFLPSLDSCRTISGDEDEAGRRTPILAGALGSSRHIPRHLRETPPRAQS
jgi:hypothetical protein